jgi:hypothetical protein
MNEKLKARLESLKTNVKKNAPLIITAASTLVGAAGWVVAGIYAQKVKAMETVDPDAWPTIEVSPWTMKSVQEGATLKYRQAQYGPKTFYSQSTTMDDFGDNADRAFEQFKQTGEFDDSTIVKEYDDA